MELRIFPKTFNSPTYPEGRQFGYNNTAFAGARADKVLKYLYEKASDNGALTASGAALVATCILRPATIMATPGVETENKKIASSKSIASGVIGFLFMYLVSTPFADAVKKLNKEPSKYMNPETLNALGITKDIAIDRAGNYTILARCFKMLPDLICAIPKSALTIALITPIMAFLFKPEKKNKEPAPSLSKPMPPSRISNGVFAKFGTENKKQISFKGGFKDGAFYNKLTDLIAAGIGKTMDLKSLQCLAGKIKNFDVEKYIMSFTSGVLTILYIKDIKKSHKLEEKRKTPLMYNAGIAWVLSTIGAFTIDGLIDIPLKKYTENFKNANADNPKLGQHMAGMKLLKSALIFGMMYRWIVPWLSTIFAEKIWKAKEKQ